MISIRKTMSNDKDFNNFFRSLIWTEGIKYRRPNLLNDECAKIMLADKKNTKFLKYLISAILLRKVTSIEILDVALGKKYKNDRAVYLDIMSKIDGLLVNIEVQLLYQKFYDLRTFWHLSNIFSSTVNGRYHELKKVELKKIKHDEFLKDISPIISINICGFNIDKNDNNYFWDFGFVDKVRLNRTMAEEVEIYFIELPKFKKQFENKKVTELKTPLEKWLYFFLLCNTKEKLAEFLDIYEDEDIFYQYEEKIEEVSRMLDFATIYENSLYNTIEFMSPAEEFEEYRQQVKKEMEAKDRKFKTELETKDRQLKAKDKALEELKLELEKQKNMLNNQP